MKKYLHIAERIGWFVLLTGMYLAYRYVAEISYGHVTLQTWVDQMIPFVPAFVIFYWAANLLGPLVLVLFWQSMALIRGVALTNLLLYCIQLLFYYYVPVRMIRPDLSNAQTFLEQAVAQVYAIDPPVNAFPSLHVSGTVLANLIVYRYYPRLGIALMPLTLAIVLSTLFVKQHYVIDVLGGLVLAVVVYGVGYLLFFRKHATVAVSSK